MPERTDHNEAMRLADELVEEAERRVCHVAMAPASLLKDAAALLRQLSAERDQLRAEVERLRADAERLDWLESEADDLRTVTTGEDDYDWVVISHHMAKPHEREVGRASTARAALDAARTTHKETE